MDQKQFANENWQSEPLAVLVSGGPDSMILVAELTRQSPRVHPLYVRCGLFWEREEENALDQFLRAIASPSLAPLQILEVPLHCIYGEHWSMTGSDTPDADSLDEAVLLPGRNLLVVTQAALWCHLHQVSTIALGLLKGNPFPDSTDEFFHACESVFSLGLKDPIQIVRPYSGLTKTEVLKRERDVPLEHTWSCIRPVRGVHCGACNKCAERQRAFLAAERDDPTQYAVLHLNEKSR